jgi:small subunit ribosomal protein S6e
MASFKINIADPKTSKCFKTEVKDEQAAPLMGLNIGEKIEGGKLGIEGYEFLVTGGTDYCGFPMRRGILGERKRIVMYKGLGFSGGLKGMKKRKTVCGHKINDKISAVNLKVVKEGAKKLSELFGKEKPETKEQPKEKPKKETKPEQKKEEASKHQPKEEKKPEVEKSKQEAPEAAEGEKK